MAAFHGIQVYEILENGNLLNAIYTNTGNSHGIDNEIAHKIQPLNAGIVGTYNVRYIESINTTVTQCDLEIKGTNGVYDFIWKQKGKIIWSGIGLLAGTNHIAVSYVEP